MFGRTKTASRLRRQAQTDDQVARVLLTQVVGLKSKARDRREKALVLEREEAKAHLQTVINQAGQIWYEADVNARQVAKDAAVALAVARQAQADYEVAAVYATCTRQRLEKSKTAYDNFTGENTDESEVS